MSAKFNMVRNDMEKLCERFLRGEDFHLDLCNLVLDTYSRDYRVRYEIVLKYIKEILSSSKRTALFDVVQIEVEKKMTDKDLAVLIRYINLCHRDKEYIILVNKDIVYTPKSLLGVKEEAVVKYVNSILGQMKVKHKLRILGNKIDNTFNPKESDPDLNYA